MCLKIYLGILPKPLFCPAKIYAKNYERRYAKCNSEIRELPSDLRKMKRNL
jgi:hypothetical protein